MRWGVVAAPCLAGAALLWVGLSSRLGPGPGAGGEAPVGAAAAPEPARIPTAAAGSPRRQLPGSLHGTEPDGGLAVDAADRFVPGPEALALFDWALAATGEAEAPALRALLVEEIERRLPPAAAAQAVGFLDRYLAYRAAARALHEGDWTHLPLERRLQLVRELRREHFGAELTERLFGVEEALARVEVERIRVARDASLAPEERARRLAALEEALPPAEREARREARSHLALRESERALREAGARDPELHALRAARFGPEAAERLARLDRERAVWEARVAAYRAELAALRAETPDEAAYRAARAALRARHFQGPDLLRISALDPD